MLQLSDQLLRANRLHIPADEYQATLDADGIVASAKEQADAIILSAKKEFEEQKRLGFQQGLMAGRAEVAEEMVSSVSRTVDYFSKLESQLVELVTSAVRKVIGDVDDRERIVKITRHALSVARNQSKVTVRVAPEDFESVQSQTNEIIRPYPAVQFLDVVADRRLEPGSCILETDVGVVDASVDVQLKAIENSLSKSVGMLSGAE